jgi:hypothetical protein
MIGLLASLGISLVPAADPARKFRANPFADLGGQLRVIAADRVLEWAVIGNTYLWFLAALFIFSLICLPLFLDLFKRGKSPLSVSPPVIVPLPSAI